MNKLNLLLDLDQTLISAEATEEYDFDDRSGKAEKFKFHDMDRYYIVFERPGLQEFLDYIFKTFNVSVWTAASKDYAAWIVDNILIRGDANRRLDWVFVSYHCSISEDLKDHSKSLDMLWDEFKLDGYNERNTLILDDYEEDVYLPQTDRCILAKPFHFEDPGSERDTFLKQLTAELKKYETNPRGNPAAHINAVLHPGK